MKRFKRIYIGQFDAYWSCNIQDGIAFLREGIEGTAYDLDEDKRFKRISGRPHGVYRDRDSGASDGGINYLDHPCDWDAEQFKYHLDLIEEELKERESV